MSETSNKYWIKRQEAKYLAGEKKVNDYYIGLKKSFEQSKREIEKSINDFVMRYGKENNSPSYASALRNLNRTEIGDLQAFIDKANEHMGEYDQELNNMSYKARVTRYQALQLQIDAQLQQLYAIDYQAKSEDLLKELYSDSYYTTWYNSDIYKGFHSEFAQINAQTVSGLIAYPFSGADFSTRLWKQKDYMLQILNESVTTMLVQGKNPITLSQDFSKKFATKEYEAYRLLHTESSFIMEQGTQAAYTEDGVEKYQWLATLDINTCEDCRALDGETFEVGKGVLGVNIPPLHCFDRCTTVPYYDDQDLSEETRIARDSVTGKNYSVPADMTYKDWHDKYIVGNPEAMLAEKKLKNVSADKQQYDNYKELLGTDYISKSFDEFQTIKYGSGDKYGIIKAQAKGMGYYNKAIINEPEISNIVKNVSKSTDMKTLGFEKRIKTKKSFLEKIEKNYNPSGNEYEVKDIVRYTLGLDVDNLSDKTLQAIDNFAKEGYNTVAIKNTWKPYSSYKGINTSLVAPSGQVFEMQYHTQESFDLKNGELHSLYEKQRLIKDDESDEYLELEDKMITLSDKLTTPKDIGRVKNK